MQAEIEYLSQRSVEAEQQNVEMRREIDASRKAIGVRGLGIQDVKAV
jgi:hypothetical protein